MCQDAYVLVRAQVMGIGPSTPPRGSSDLMEKPLASRSPPQLSSLLIVLRQDLINSARLAG